MDNKSFEERRLAANAKLLEAIDLIDPADEKAGEKYAEVAKLYHELNEDIKTELNHQDSLQKNKIERERIKVEANTKAEAIRMERERTSSEAKTEKRKAVFDILGKIMIAAASIFAGISQLWMFKRSTEKEKDEALLTQTDQTIVRNGLSGRFFD